MMPNTQRHHITDVRDLNGQEGGIFSVAGMKAKLFSFGQHEALFSILLDGKYQKGSSVAVVKHTDLPDSDVYKLGRFKS